MSAKAFLHVRYYPTYIMGGGLGKKGMIKELHQGKYIVRFTTLVVLSLSCSWNHLGNLHLLILHIH